MAYISNRLTHWAGRGAESDDARYDTLVNKIVAKRELLFSPCAWEFRSKYGGVNNFSIPMISFTDIPFSEAAGHCSRYSPFGISFAKHYLANCLVSPVAYVLNPFASKAYSDLFHSLEGIKSLVDGQVIPEGRYQGRVCNVQQMKADVQALALWYQNYDRQEYVFNESQPDPHDGQETFFDRSEALYYEREWRMVERDGSRFPWDEYREGRHYFRFEPKYVRFLIMPHAYLERFSADSARCLQDYPFPHAPVLAFEDLMFF